PAKPERRTHYTPQLSNPTSTTFGGLATPPSARARPARVGPICRHCIATERSRGWPEMTVPRPDSTMAAEAATSNRLRISITTEKGGLTHEYATSREVALRQDGAAETQYVCTPLTF